MEDRAKVLEDIDNYVAIKALVVRHGLKDFLQSVWKDRDVSSQVSVFDLIAQAPEVSIIIQLPTAYLSSR